MLAESGSDGYEDESRTMDVIAMKASEGDKRRGEDRDHLKTETEVMSDEGPGE